MSIPTRQAWDEIARKDPLWAILSDPKKRHGRWQLDDFFATGEEELAGVLRVAQDLGRPSRMRLALDVGCGVGRVTRAMAARFERCVGIDISPAMIEQARTLNRDLTNCEFLVSVQESKLDQLEDESFDFVYSGFVLQHLPNAHVVHDLIRELLRVVKRDGLAVFQLPAPMPLRNRLQVRPRLYALGRRAGASETVLVDVLGLHPIRMRGLRVEVLNDAVRAMGTEVLAQVPADETKPGSGFRYYVGNPDVAAAAG